MASLVNSKNKRRIFFKDRNGDRKLIYLGRINKKQGQTILRHVEELAAAQITQTSPPNETLNWLNEIGESLKEKLAKVGLAERQQSRHLGSFLVEYVAKRRKSVKESTVTVWKHAERSLVEFFGSDMHLRDITAGDASDFRDHLLGLPLAESTTRKRCAIASMMFRYAVKKKLISQNPFEDVPKANMATKSHAFVEREVAVRVLKHLPGTEWQLLFALARWGGLRVGSEVRRLEWSHIDWERERITVTSPKTAHYEGRDSRDIPLFPELYDLLSKRFVEAVEGDCLVLPMLTGRSDASLRKPLQRAIENAGEEVWPRLWHNMRATRQTELEKRFPSHVVCSWMGNSRSIAAKHYLQVTDSDFSEATQNESAHQRAQQATAPLRTDTSEQPIQNKNQLVLQGCATPCDGVQMYTVVREGLEPPTKGL